MTTTKTTSYTKNQNDAKVIADTLKPLVKENMAVSNVIEIGAGYVLGLCTKNEKGYIPTLFRYTSENYELSKRIADEVNSLLFPKRDVVDTYKIVLSTMTFN